ncbi:MAG: alkaline phosphatase PhoX [Solirubrobacterales bacterium]
MSHRRASGPGEGGSRREFMRTGLVAAGALAFGPAFWSEAVARPARRGLSPYGRLGPADANGLRLPDGFSSRIVARGGTPVEGTSYDWHIFSDGASTFRRRNGGWILVSNSELPTPVDLPLDPPIGNAGDGGASAIRFGPDGTIEDAYRILSDTSSNCAGGATPWGTWLSCEETDTGQVWECDPRGVDQAKARPALGVFSHEAVCVDPRRGHVYLSEDDGEGGLYRFTPERVGDLRSGRLEIAKVHRNGGVEWRRVPDPSAATVPTRQQVQGATQFRRGEGIWFDSDHVYLATTSDSKIWSYNVRQRRIRTIYDPALLRRPPLTDVDNITVSRSGDLFVCEDNGGDDPFDIAIITPAPKRRVARFLKLTGPQHGDSSSEAVSEVAGVCFNPRGDRMYLASQRAFTVGVVYEVSGPFRGAR